MTFPSPFTGEDLPESCLKLIERAKFGNSVHDGMPVVLLAMIVDGETMVTAMTPDGAKKFAVGLLKALATLQILDPGSDPDTWLN